MGFSLLRISIHALEVRRKLSYMSFRCCEDKVKLYLKTAWIEGSQSWYYHVYMVCLYLLRRGTAGMGEVFINTSSTVSWILSIGRLWLDPHRVLLCRFNKQNAFNLSSYIKLSNAPVICDHFKNPLKLFSFLLKLGEPMPDAIYKIKKPDTFDK